MGWGEFALDEPFKNDASFTGRAKLTQANASPGVPSLATHASRAFTSTRDRQLSYWPVCGREAYAHFRREGTMQNRAPRGKNDPAGVSANDTAGDNHERVTSDEQCPVGVEGGAWLRSISTREGGED